jgi:hypothetical protein
MNNNPGTANGSNKQQPGTLQATAQVALGKLLLLKAGIAKGEGDKPTEINLDKETKLVIQSAINDIQQVITGLNEQSQSKDKAKPKQKKKQ